MREWDGRRRRTVSRPVHAPPVRFCCRVNGRDWRTRGPSALKRGGKQMSKTRLIVAALCAVVIAAVGASSAFAGESTGNGKQTPIGLGGPPGPLHASSFCSFSGQNPEGLLDPSDPDFEPGRVQNWGHVDKDF